ncbi:hypothetical protein SLS62_008022 [Diatrype stigma]|uniref:DNA/RNA-binding domain-containing protein n=1 Tax=Diatrype stigma TaxID=117547 RepID=A0AAN9UL60_9PEZI
MAIEDDDIRDRDVWTSVSRLWYSKASDKAPTTGRLYHHLAILARPNALQQLFYYTKALSVPIPFASARDSIMTLFEPLLRAPISENTRLIPIDAGLVKAHAIIFTGRLREQFDSALEEFLPKLANHINTTGRNWLETGYHVSISICCSLLSYGKEDNEIHIAISQTRDEATEMAIDTTESETKPEKSFALASRLMWGTCAVIFRRIGDNNVLPFVHVIMVFIFHLTHYPDAISLVDDDIPWELLSVLLNSLLQSYRDYERIRSSDFPRQAKEVLPRPLPEDFAMKGLPWAEKYHPDGRFSNEEVDDDEKYFEMASMSEERKERILWLGYRIATHGKWLVYDDSLHQFQPGAKYQGRTRDADMMSTLDAEDSISGISTVGSGQTSVHAEKGDNEMMDVDNDEEDSSDTSHTSHLR